MIGIDTGITMLMAENLRTGFVWETFMKTPEAQLGMQRAGFRQILTVLGALSDWLCAPTVSPDPSSKKPFQEADFQCIFGEPPVAGAQPRRCPPGKCLGKTKRLKLKALTNAGSANLFEQLA